MAFFGNASTTPAAGTSMFGAANNTNTNQPVAGGSLFGSFGAQNTQNATNAQQPGTSLFGGGSTNPNTGTQQPAGASLFGNANTATPNAGTGSSLFGSNTAGNNMFGKPATATTGTGTGTSLFGASTNAPAAGMFGSNQTQPVAAGTGGSGFFATPPAGQQPQQNANQPKPGLFGSTTTNTNPLFGNTSTTNAPSGTGSLFGGASTSTNPLFGGSTMASGQAGTGIGTSSLFGSTNNTPPAVNTGNTLGGSSLFGGNNTFGASTLGTSALGKPAVGLSSNTLGSQYQGADAQVQFARLQEKIESIYGAWNAQNPASCRFQHYFYNTVEPSQVNLYGRPVNAVNEALWQKAIRDNPDPTCMVPVLAIGFDDLQGRVDAQAAQSAEHKEKLLVLQKTLHALATNHSTLTVPRLQRYSALQTQLMHRLLRLVQHLHLVIPSVRSSAISESEEALRASLEEVVVEVGVSGRLTSNPNPSDEAFGKGRLKSKLGELWAVIGSLKAREQSLNATFGGSSEWKVVDDEGLARIAQILAEQQAGLAHLTKILHKDLKDLAVILGGDAGESIDALGSSVGGREGSMRGSTMRTSFLR
ncbi:hypothetical protein D9757_000943 [Collybiopsis confluens]|uniref:Nucleoporin Nup54 alpha-helical domain-containing protein n=1 Tax=Collybiopsis confluens TaxID=2823264 RepID=A0A8H5I037_9AGAR|nr:hypothetical protein D9757_000943 [Collybiopsis confluens]